MIDLNSFQRNSDFYGDLHLLITIKSFDLQAIRKRYLESKKNKSGKAGSVSRREPGLGGVAGISIKNGEIYSERMLAQLKEPRGVDAYNDRIAIAAEDVVHLWKGDKYSSIQNPWFSYIHTVHLNRKDPKRILISSSGLDCLFEYDWDSSNCNWEWFAWENGFQNGTDPKSGEDIFLTRNAEEAEALSVAGKKFKLISNPKEEVLPTAMRAAFINSALYDDKIENSIIATFFHEGAAFRIDQKSMKAEKVISNMKNPHGGRRLGNGYLATSTGQGQVVLKNESGEERFSFSDLPNKPEELGDSEWLQNTAIIRDHLITIDSNRTSFVIWNPEKKLFDMIPYNDDWAVQDLMPSEGTEKMWGEINRISLD